MRAWFSLVTQPRASYSHLLKKVVLKVVLPDTFGSLWAMGSYRAVKADATLISNFSGVALQICFRNREERGELDSICSQNEEDCGQSHL